METLGKTLLWTVLLLLTLYGFLPFCYICQLWRRVSSILTAAPHSCCRFQSDLLHPSPSNT